MAVRAVKVTARRRFARNITINDLFTCIGMVLMVVVPEVLRSSTAFVPAIACGCSPSELEWQQRHQDDHEETMHAGKCISVQILSKSICGDNSSQSTSSGTMPR